jgi:hypothetical protein
MKNNMLHSICGAAFVLVAGCLAAAPSFATWSIVITDSATGEIAIGSATCVTGIDLKREAGVVVVGRGAGAAQSFVDGTGRNRGVLFDELQAGTDPLEILDILEAQDTGHQTRQYGIADTQGRAAAFSGTDNGDFAGDLTGTSGSLAYAVQGNVITGQAVLDAAEQALLQPGDLPTRLMRSMLAAREKGGDGRCSCSPGNPDGCGSPPPDFDKTADVGYMLVTRLGDADGSCNGSQGCANGDYYMDLNVAFQGRGDPDPVFTLLQDFVAFRQSQQGRPDHYRSLSIPTAETLPADGVSTAQLVIVARDLRGARVPVGGALVDVSVDPGSEAQVAIAPPIDLDNGIYIVPLRAGEVAGTVRLQVTIDDGDGVVQLAPPTEIALTAN